MLNKSTENITLHRSIPFPEPMPSRPQFCARKIFFYSHYTRLHCVEHNMFATTILCTILPILLINQCLASEEKNTSINHMRDLYDNLFGGKYSTTDGDGKCLHYNSWKNKVKFFQAAYFCAVKQQRLPLATQNDLELINDYIGKYYGDSPVWIVNQVDPEGCYVARYNSGSNDAVTDAAPCDYECNVFTIYDSSLVSKYCPSAEGSKLTD